MGERDDFYRAKAEECEAGARETPDPRQRDQWLKMAADWRSMVLGPLRPLRTTTRRGSDWPTAPRACRMPGIAG